MYSKTELKKKTKQKNNLYRLKLEKSVELLLVINLRVETLIQPGRCQLSAPSMHKVKTGVHMKCTCTCTSPRTSVMKERLSHAPFCLLLCSGIYEESLSSHNCKVCTRGKFT